MPAPTPTDEPGYCLSTIHDFGMSEIVNGITFGVSPAGDFLYLARGGSSHITRIDTATWTPTPNWAVVNGQNGLTVDVHGNIYALGTTTIAQVDPSGAVTSPWATLAAGWTGISIGYGRDGALYVTAHNGGGTYSVFQITGGGL